MSTTSLDLRLQAPNRDAKPQIHSLTGLRFFAALHVVVFHLWLNLKADYSALPAWAVNIASNGYLGVPLFFLLSGFVMAITYLDPTGHAGGRIDAKRYWIARLARIYPVYLLSLAVSVPYLCTYALPYYPEGLAGLKAAAVMGLHGTLLQSWYPPIMQDVNPPSWSLSVEAFFYAVFPFLVTSLGLMKLDRKSLYQVAALSWGCSLALSILTVLLVQTHPGLAIVGAYRCVFPLFRLPDFMLGIVVGRLFLLRRQEGGHPAGPGALTWVSAIGILVALALITDKADHNLVSSLMLVPFAALVFGLSHQSGHLSRWLSRPGMVLLGEASYAVYILHVPVMFAVFQAFNACKGLPVISHPLCLHAVYFALTIGLSVLVFRRLEAPMRERIKRALA